ncbi:MAG TPA: hypothetical protein VGZ00_07900 [Candidatus Baltobacteraceae bacterium]|jgi:hypothetical protein|nr:hypothetical protein [Candidatus Baltobacteraceae bacterium]
MWCYLPKPEEYRAKLETHGFVVKAVESAAALTPLPAGLRGLLHTFYNSFVEDFDQRERSNVFDVTVNLLTPSLRDRNGDWSYDAVRLHCKATL